VTKDQKANGTAVALADLVNSGVQQPERPEPRSASARPRPPKAAAPAAPQPEGWAGAVPKSKVTREPINVGLPVELDLHRRLRRYRADTNVEIQDFVAAVLHEALEQLGYHIE
jgi:hypothetical protein